MSRLLMLYVKGGSSEPYYRLVSVEDPVRFLGIMRARVLKDQINKMDENPLTDEAQANALRTLKVKLYETGYKDYPDTDEEVAKLYRRFRASIS